MIFDNDEGGKQGISPDCESWFDQQTKASETDCKSTSQAKVISVIGPYEINDDNREYYEIIDTYIERLKVAGYVPNKIEVVFPQTDKWPLHFVRRFSKQVEATDVLNFFVLTDNWYSTISFFIAMSLCVGEFEDEISSSPLEKDNQECDEDLKKYYPEIMQCRFSHYPYSDAICDPCNSGIRFWTISFQGGDGYVDKNFAMNFLARMENLAKKIEDKARENQGFERSSYESIYGLLETGLFI